jgi:hypothetical protein
LCIYEEQHINSFLQNPERALNICIHYKKALDSKEYSLLKQRVQITNLFIFLLSDLTMGTAGQNISSL